MAQREQASAVRKVVTCFPQSRLQARMELQRSQPEQVRKVTVSATRGEASGNSSSVRPLFSTSVDSSTSATNRQATQHGFKVVVVRRAAATSVTQQQSAYDTAVEAEVRDRERSETLRADSELELTATVNEAIARVNAEQQNDLEDSEVEMASEAEHVNRTWPPQYDFASAPRVSARMTTNSNTNANANAIDSLMDLDALVVSDSHFDTFATADNAIESELLSLIGATNMGSGANELDLDTSSAPGLFVLSDSTTAADDVAQTETDDAAFFLQYALDAGYGSHVTEHAATAARGAALRSSSSVTAIRPSQPTKVAAVPRLSTGAISSTSSTRPQGNANAKATGTARGRKQNAQSEQPKSPSVVSSSQYTATSTATSLSEVDDLSDILHLEVDHQSADLYEEGHLNEMFSPESAVLGINQVMTNSCPSVLAGYGPDTYLLSPQQGAPVYAGVAIDPCMIKYDPILAQHITPQTRQVAYSHAQQPTHASTQAIVTGPQTIQQAARRPAAPIHAATNALIATPASTQNMAARAANASANVGAHSQRLASTGAYTNPSAAHSPATSSGRRRHSTTTSKQMRADDEPSDEKTRIKKDIHNTIERRRRVNINERIKELGTMLPRTGDGDFKNHKGTVLKESVEYIKRLQRNEQQLRNANVSLQKRVAELEHMLRQNNGVVQSSLHGEATELLATESSFAFLNSVVKDEPGESVSANDYSDSIESQSESGGMNGESEQN